MTQTSALVPCMLGGGVDLASVVSSVCTSSGLERNDSRSSEAIMVTLQGAWNVTMFPSSSVPSQLQFEILSLPAHGQLVWFPGGSSNRTAASSQVQPISLVDPGSRLMLNDTLVYVSDVSYYNRIAGSQFVTLDGDGIDGCVLQKPSCPCDRTTFPGCPDTFTFRMWLGERWVSATIGTYTLYVDSQPSPIADLDLGNLPLPSGQALFVYGLVDVGSYVPLNWSTDTIRDPDGSAYYVSCVVHPTVGKVSLLGPPSQVIAGVTPFHCTTGCTVENPMILVGTVPNLNAILPYVYFYADQDVYTNFSASLVSLTVYKPWPSGSDPERIGQSIQANQYHKTNVLFLTDSLFSTTILLATSQAITENVIIGTSVGGGVLLLFVMLFGVRYMRAQMKRGVLDVVEGRNSAEQDQLDAVKGEVLSINDDDDDLDSRERLTPQGLSPFPAFYGSLPTTENTNSPTKEEIDPLLILGRHHRLSGIKEEEEEKQEIQ